MSDPFVQAEADLALFRGHGGNAASLAQTGWFIDPQNVSGTASNNNDGLTAATALRTWSELALRLGLQGTGRRGPIATTGDVVVTFLSSQTDDSDPVVTDGIIISVGSLIFTGAQTVVHAGALNVTQAKNRATGMLWQVDLGTPADTFVGKLLFDTTAGAVAFIRAQIGGAGSSVVELTQPLQPVATVAPGTAPKQVDTLANGDAYQVLSHLQVNFVSLQYILDLPTFGGPFFDIINGVIVEHLTGFDPEGVGNSNLDIGYGNSFVECVMQRTVNQPSAWATGFRKYCANVWFRGGIFGGSVFSIIGGQVDEFLNLPWRSHLDGDVIVNATLRDSQCEFGYVYIPAGKRLRPTRGWEVSVYSPAPNPVALFWGPGGFDVADSGTYYHNPAQPYAGTFLQLGTLTVDGANGGPALSTYHTVDAAYMQGPAGPLTGAQLDAAQGAFAPGGIDTGYSGTAINVLSGARITNQPSEV